MINKQILQSDLLDVLFENRNKAYGAYALRKNYNKRLQWALGIAMAMIPALWVTNFSNTTKDGWFFSEKVVQLSHVDLSDKKPKAVEIPKPKIRPQMAQTAYTSKIKIVDNTEKTQMPDKNQIDSYLISSKTIAGITATGENGSATSPGNEGSSNNGTPKKERDVTFSQSDAQFPGGKEAFAKFLTRYLITPGDLEAGEKKLVMVRFMVDVDGSISKMEVIQSDGEEYSKEVMRVLGKMPKWIPAVQNGAKVATWFSQPVSFIGVEQ
jgi:protein TonB